MKFRSRSFVEKKKVKRKMFFWVFSISTLAFLGFFFWFIYADIFQIKETVIKGNSYVEEASIREIIDRKINEKTLGFIPHTNILFFPKVEILNEIRSIAPVKSVKYSRADNTVEFQIEERVPSYVYCEGDYPTDDTCYFADEMGFVFLKSPAFNNYPYLRLYAKINTFASSSVGVTVRDKSDIDFAHSVVDYLASKDINSDAISFGSDSIYFTINIGDALIYVAYKDNLESFKSKFEAITKDKDAKKFLESLKYLDLRLNTKVFLKEK